MPTNHYTILGIPPNADENTIKAAYRHLVHLYHPDISTDPNASAKIIQINSAYTVLKDPIKRAEYDLINGINQPKKPNTNATKHNNVSDINQTTTIKQQPPIFDNSPLFGSASFSFDAVFSAFENDYQNDDQRPSDYNNHDGITQFGHHYNPKDPTKGIDTDQNISINLNLAYKGGLFTINTNVPTRQKNGNLLEESKNLTIKIPKGVIDGQRICLKNMGKASPVGGENGDLYLNITINTPNNVRLNNADVYQTLNITPWEALLGANIQVNTIIGRLAVNVPKNSQSKQTICFKDKGIPATKPGNFYFIINIVNPDITHMDTTQQKAYQQLQKICQTLQIDR